MASSRSVRTARRSENVACGVWIMRQSAPQKRPNGKLFRICGRKFRLAGKLHATLTLMRHHRAMDEFLISARPDLQQARLDWLASLSSERRLSKLTVEAYERDTRQF